MVFLKELFEKVDFEKNQQTTKKREKLPRGQRVNSGLPIRGNNKPSEVFSYNNAGICSALNS